MASAQGDEQGKADAEDGERDEEVGVGEDGSGVASELHGCPAGERGMDWGNHNDARGGVSRMRGWGAERVVVLAGAVAGIRLGSGKGTVTQIPVDGSRGKE